MSKKLTKKPIVQIVLVILTVFVVGIAIAQLMAKNAVSNFLIRKLPHHVQLNYNGMDVNVLNGTVSLKDITLDFYDRDSMLLNTSVRMDDIALEGLGYWDFLFHKKIDVKQLLLKRPQVRYYPYRLLPKKDAEPEGVVKLLKGIAIGKLSVENGRLDLLQQGEDSIALSVKDVNFFVLLITAIPRRLLLLPISRQDTNRTILYIAPKIIEKGFRWIAFRLYRAITKSRLIGIITAIDK